MERKNVLFISRNFFEYDQRIKLALETRGYNIVSYSIFPKYSIIDKVCKRILKNRFVDRKAKRQQKNMLADIDKSGTQYDIVFLLAGQTIRRDTVEELRRRFSSAKFVWYIWDDISRLKEYDEINHLFDIVISFDKIDAQKYGTEYSPLFFFREYKLKKEYDIGFIGTDHSDRRRILNKILEKKNFTAPFIYIYTSKVWKLLYKITNPFGKINKYIRTESLTTDESAVESSKCKVVIDLTFPNQTGLSMRVFEAVGGHSKVITTNSSIKMYDFYKENNFYIIDRENLTLPPDDFFSSPFEEINNNILKYYHFSNWIERLVGYFEKT